MASRDTHHLGTRELDVIILTGEGPLAFCSGGDQRVRGDTGVVPEGVKVGRFHVTELLPGGRARV